MQNGGHNGDDTVKYDEKYTIPAYREPVNNPMIPNVQKEIYNKGKQRDVEPKPYLNLQLYQPPKSNPTRGSHPHPSVFYPNYVPNPFDPISYANYMQHTQYGIPQQPVFKEYNININGVSGSHIKTAMLFEDSLPIKNVAGTFNSIGERIILYESVRSILFSAGDGKDVPLESDSYNLLSHLKLMDLNPYNASRFFRNPYKGMPFGFLIYRSCYPIIHDVANASSMCSRNSTGINVRIYRLTNGSYLINKHNMTKASDYDEWRDMGFYNYVKEQIIKKKVCPNFAIMYGYNITTNSGINFDELRLIQERSRQTDRFQLAPITPGNPAQQTSQAARTPNVLFPSGMRQEIALVRNPVTGQIMRHVTNVPTTEQQMIELSRYSGNVLVCLTEASDYSLIGWAKKEYRSTGNIKTMINWGYHSKNVWESILFQLMAALYVMQYKGIIIDNFRLDRNVFIKDIQTMGTSTNYWKYKIEGIEYYIPNYGYLVLIDTNYRDFDRSYDDAVTDPKRVRKLDGVFLSCYNSSIDECIQKSFDAFKSAFDPNIFDQNFINDGGVKPPEEIMRLIINIRNAIDDRPTLNIAYYIRQYMTMFLNNRIGTPLNESETNNVKKGNIKQFRRGQIVVMTDQDGIDKFVLHVKTKKSNIAHIVTKDTIDPNTSNFIEKNIPISSLNDYSILEPIKQRYKINESNLNEESLLETYTVE